MVMQKPTPRTIVTFLFIALLLVVGYYGYSYLRGDRESKPSSSPAEEPSLVSKDFLVLVQTLEASKIDTSFFENPLFQELKDGIRLPPLPLQIGRTNPFLPFTSPK